MRSLLVSAILLVSVPARADGAHEPATQASYRMVILDAKPFHSRKGKKGSLTIALEDRKTRARLGADDLQVRHEKKFHLFGFDATLGHFVHEHPEPRADKTWKVDVTFPTSGRYRLWSDVARAGREDGEQDVTDRVVRREDGAFDNELPHPASLEPRHEDQDSGSILRLDPRDARGLVAGRMAMVRFGFARGDGSSPRITDFLGARAHFLVTDLMGIHVVHTHPMLMGGEWMIHTAFPAAAEARDYRVFAQFVDAGKLRTVKLAVRVAGAPPAAAAQK